MALQRFINRHSRLRTFRGGNNRKLHVTRGIPDDEQAGNVRLAEMVGLDDALTVHLATKPRGQVALLALAARKKYRVARREGAVVKGDGPHVRTVMLHPHDS